MRIIEVGMCVDNVDPKGIGRIRYRPKGQFQSEIENSVSYEKWDKNDPFILIPFLPLHINIIPQLGQGLKIIKYDTEKAVLNMEYIAGPYTSPHDLENQTFTQQHRDTTYGGAIVKDLKDIVDSSGKFKNKLSEGSIIKIGDVGFRGNYGSDMIFTKNGVQLRGGLLIDKQNYDSNVVDNFPLLSNKMGRFTLKKFKDTKIFVDEKETTSTITTDKLNYIIEYSVVNNYVYFYIYQTNGVYGTVFNTDVFNSSTNINDVNIRKYLTLINNENDTTSPTIKIGLNTIPPEVIIRHFIFNFNSRDFDLKDYGIINPNKTLTPYKHPFFFKPTDSYKVNNININIINKVQFKTRVGHGLVFTENDVEPNAVEKTTTTKKLKTVPNSSEQSFSSLSSDKIYLTSTAPNGTDKINKINFNVLDKYELTQEDYLKNIEPNTYALVRGDILLETLRAFQDMFNGHIHQINKPPIIGSDPNRQKFDKLMLTIEDELLNKSIRIN